jgi:HK97 family phage portal protein
MEFKFNKLFSGSKEKSFVLGIEELGRIFNGQSSWNKSSQLKQYSKSLYVFAAVNKIATKVSDIDLELHQITSAKGDNEEIMNHEILDLLTKVNPFQTRSEFLKTAWINKKVTGEAFWLKVRNNQGQVVELWNLRPDLMTVVSDPDTYVKHYELDKEDGGREIFDSEEIIHFKDPDPLNPFRGLSPLVASKSRIETEESATSYQSNFFKNNARPDALLVTEQALDGDQRTQMTSAWEERHQGRDNEARIGILEGGMKYQQVSISQREMDYIESMKFTRDDILVALGVPKSVMTTDDTSYANAETGLRMFLSETIIPEMRHLVEVLNAFLIAPDFGEQYMLDFDDPTPADREALRHDSTAAHGKWATINEIRFMNDLPPIEGGDVIADTSSQGGFQSGSPDGQTSDEGTKQLSQIIPMDEVKYRKTEEMRKKALKLLQGRPNLRRKFELHDTFRREISKSVKNAKKAVKTASKGKKNKKVVKEVDLDDVGSMFGEEEIRKTYVDLINKRLDKRQKPFERELQSQFAQQMTRVLKNMDELEDEQKGVYQKLSHSAINRIMKKDDEKSLFAAFALPFLVEYAGDGAKDSATLVGEEFDMTEQLTASMEKRSIFFADSVVDTTFNSLVRTLTEGTNNGEGIGDLKQRVRDVYGEIPDHRASLIARTEATNANNEGILEQFRTSDIVKGKEWIATLDDVTRDEHVELDGEIAGVNKVFSNGLMFPNEPNCRCVIGPALYK